MGYFHVRVRQFGYCFVLFGCFNSPYFVRVAVAHVCRILGSSCNHLSPVHLNAFHKCGTTGDGDRARDALGIVRDGKRLHRVGIGEKGPRGQALTYMADSSGPRERVERTVSSECSVLVLVLKMPA